MELKVEEDKGHGGQQAEHLHLGDRSQILETILNFYDSNAYPTNCLLEVANRSRPGQAIAGVTFLDRLDFSRPINPQYAFEKIEVSRVIQVLNYLSVGSRLEMGSFGEADL